MLPSATGGANWQGGALDPESNIFYIFSNTNISALGLVPGNPERNRDFAWVQGTARNPDEAATATGSQTTSATAAAAGASTSSGAPPAAAGGGGAGGGGGALSVRGLPLVKPPYGRITAIDLNRGELVWQIAHGETPDNIRNHPALTGIDIPRTGRQGRIGTLVTKTLVIAGEGGFFSTPSGRGAMLRAYEKASGKEVGAVYMPAPQTGSPMTYMVGGRQHIVVSVSGAGHSGELLAFRLSR
jgi:quinoprotein glucose dehydrogenase